VKAVKKNEELDPKVNLEFPEELFYLLMTKKEILDANDLTEDERESEIDNFFA